MSGCRISAASKDGAHVLRLEGDVRLTMCTALDEYLERIFNNDGFKSVSVDVTRATGLDSTTLGMLAKLAIQTQQRFEFKPAIFSCSAGIDRLLDSMGFAQLFDIRNDRCDVSDTIDDIPMKASTESEMKAKIIEAHRTLMSINDANHSAFRDLVKTLENS